MADGDTRLILRRASVAPGREVDLFVDGGRLVAEAPPGAEVLDVGGRPVVPGLADHHVHLMAQAAAWSSVDCSPDVLAAGDGLAAVLRAARARRPTGWLRGVGYDLATSGPIDRAALDASGAGPVRIQDRTGILWLVDSAGLEALLPSDRADWPDGIGVDAAGNADGTLRRLDAWIRTRLDPDPPDLTAVGAWLASRGVTSITDATATNGPAELALLAGGGLPQRLMAMTAEPTCPAVDGVELGPVKVVLDEAHLPPLDDLTTRVAAAHAAGRRVALHCVDPVSLVLALTAGAGPGDRIEHASLVPDDVVPIVAERGVTVVVNPGLVRTRGDRYLTETDPSERPGLHRLGSFLAAGIPVAAGSDAPHGPLDPWVSIAAAVDRATAAGKALGAGERVDVMTALALHTGSAADPTTPRRLTPGSPADLAVLDADWSSLTQEPPVALTMIAGRIVHGSGL